MSPVGFLRGQQLPARLMSWKNGLFVVSAERLRRHSVLSYESAMRYIIRNGRISHGLADVGGAFERLWQVRLQQLQGWVGVGIPSGVAHCSNCRLILHACCALGYYGIVRVLLD